MPTQEVVMADSLACTNCGQGRPIELQMTTKSGQVLTMTSCPRCESRSWYAAHQPVSIDAVLKITAKDPEIRMNHSDRTVRQAAREH